MSYRECNQMDVGRIVEVRDGEEGRWFARKLIAIIPGRDYPFIVELDNHQNYIAAYANARTFCRPVDESDEGKVGLVLAGVEYPGARLIKVITDNEDLQKYAVYKICQTLNIRKTDTVSLP